MLSLRSLMASSSCMFASHFYKGTKSRGVFAVCCLDLQWGLSLQCGLLGIWYRTKHQVLSHPYNNLVAFSPVWHLRKHNLCMHLSASSQFLQSSLPTGASNPNTPLLSSLVQTLSSIAGIRPLLRPLLYRNPPCCHKPTTMAVVVVVVSLPRLLLVCSILWFWLRMCSQATIMQTDRHACV